MYNEAAGSIWNQISGTAGRQGLKMSEKYFRQKKAVPEEIVPLSYTMVKETTAYADVRGRFLLLYKN